MARISASKPPTVATSTSRSEKAAAPVSFVDEDDDEINEGGSDSDTFDMGKFMKAIQKKKTKKSTISNMAFETNKKEVSNAARKAAHDVSRDGIAYIENLKSELLGLKEDDLSYDQCVEELVPMWDLQDNSVASLMEIYNPAINDLFLRRSTIVNDACKTVEDNPTRRKEALARCLTNARVQVDKSQQDEMNATDATNLIKHYRALLRN